MRKRVRIDAQRESKKGKNGSSIVRILCGLLCLVFLMSACVGCDSYASTDDMSALKGELENALKEIAALQDEYAAALLELEALKTAHAEASAALETLKIEYESTKQALESSDQAANEADAAAKQALDQLKEQYQEAQKKIASLEKAIGDAQEETDSLKESYAAAQEELAGMKEQLEELEKQLEELKEQQPNPDPPSSEEPSGKIRIYIDQGHNPTPHHNTGAVGNELYEQDLTYSIGILLAAVLEKDGRFEICLSRPTEDTVLGTDYDSSLEARVQGAKDFDADYFISLHVNAFTESTASGNEAYYIESDEEAYSLGYSILEELTVSTNLRNRGMKPGPNLYVLKNATMPAVLLELGFISNPQDAAMLSKTPEVFVNGIYNGILDHFDLELPEEEITPPSEQE